MPQGSLSFGDSHELLDMEQHSGSLQRQLAQAEAALRAKQHQCELLKEEVEESQGNMVQAQVQLQRSHSRAERLAGLVNEANQERRG